MYGVDLDGWREELVQGTMADPKEMERVGRGIAERLGRGRELRLHHANGTDLRLQLKGRKADVDVGLAAPRHGRAPQPFLSLPAGFVRVAVDEGFAEGSFVANVDTATGLSGGVGEFSGGQWTFSGGRLARYQYAKGRAMFAEHLKGAPPDADRPGSITIGLNPAISRIPLMEDQGLGTVTFRMGRNVEFGGASRVDWWAWLLQRGSDLDVDGKPLLRAGKPIEA
jgi:leucyl aminopeptidase (aminopeptidase T)